MHTHASAREALEPNTETSLGELDMQDDSNENCMPLQQTHQ